MIFITIGLRFFPNSITVWCDVNDLKSFTETMQYFGDTVVKLYQIIALSRLSEVLKDPSKFVSFRDPVRDFYGFNCFH